METEIFVIKNEIYITKFMVVKTERERVRKNYIYLSDRLDKNKN